MSRLERKSLAPDGLPLFAPSGFMAYLGRVFVIHVVGADEASFAQYIAMMAKAIDHRKEGDDIVVFYDVSKLGEFTATQRKRLAEVLDARRQKLSESTKKLVVATQSPFVRGILQAVFWLTPPPFPYAFARDKDHAMQLIAKDEPDLDPSRLARDYEDLLGRWREAMESGR